MAGRPSTRRVECGRLTASLGTLSHGQAERVIRGPRGRKAPQQRPGERRRARSETPGGGRRERQRRHPSSSKTPIRAEKHAVYGKAGLALRPLGRITPFGSPRPTGANRSSYWRSRHGPGFLNWCPSATGACSCRRSPTSAGGPPDGGRPGNHAQLRPQRAVVRRCPSVQLRRVRFTGASLVIRRERLRRDSARTVGMGRQTAGREPRGSGS